MNVTPVFNSTVLLSYSRYKSISWLKPACSRPPNVTPICPSCWLHLLHSFCRRRRWMQHLNHLDELVQEWRNPIANALELRLSCPKPIDLILFYLILSYRIPYTQLVIKYNYIYFSKATPSRTKIFYFPFFVSSTVVTLCKSRRK